MKRIVAALALYCLLPRQGMAEPLAQPQTAAASTFIYCRATDIDRSAVLLSRIHSAGPAPLSVEEVQKYDAQAARYASAFEAHIKTTLQSNARGACTVKSTRALAEADQAKLKAGFAATAYKVVDVDWTPPVWSGASVQSAANAKGAATAEPASAVVPPITPTPAERQVQTGYASCEVMNVLTTGIQPDKWVSPVFEFSYLQGLYMHRLNGMATDFGATVASLGGSGDNVCQSGGSRQELEQSLAETRKTLSRRFLGVVSAVKYHDVAWTPGPWDARAAMAAPATDVQFVYCFAAEYPTTLASGVVDVLMPTDDMQHFAELKRYTDEFKRDVADKRLADSNVSCIESNTQGEGQHKRSDLRRLIHKGEAFIDVDWRPTPATAVLTPGTNAVAPIGPPVVQPQPVPPAVVSNAKVSVFKPVVVDLESLGRPPVLPLIFGFCKYSGTLNSSYKTFMSPVFSVRNTGGESDLVLAQRFEREYVRATDPGKMKGAGFCRVAGSHAEAELFRREILSLYALPKAEGTGPRLPPPIVTQWLPANGALAAVPEGDPVPLHIMCFVSDHARKTAWFSSMFTAPGADATAQFQAVQRLHADYRQYIVDTQRPSDASAAACTPSENQAVVDGVIAGQAGLLGKMGYTVLSVDWKPTE